MNLKEEERRARLLRSRAERLPDIKKQFEESQGRNFNSNFKPGGKDAALVGSRGGASKNASRGAKNGSQGKSATKKGKKTAKKAVNQPAPSKAKVEAEKRKVLPLLLRTSRPNARYGR